MERAECDSAIAARDTLLVEKARLNALYRAEQAKQDERYRQVSTRIEQHKRREKWYWVALGALGVAILIK